jgi:hypothetical protein
VYSTSGVYSLLRVLPTENKKLAAGQFEVLTPNVVTCGYIFVFNSLLGAHTRIILKCILKNRICVDWICVAQDR